MDFSKFRPLVTVAPVDQWVSKALGELARPHVARLEQKTGITGVENAFRAGVSQPAGRAAQSVLREAMRRFGR